MIVKIIGFGLCRFPISDCLLCLFHTAQNPRITLEHFQLERSLVICTARNRVNVLQTHPHLLYATLQIFYCLPFRVSCWTSQSIKRLSDLSYMIVKFIIQVR